MIAITRPVSRSIDRCELTHLARTPIDYDNAARQHAHYEKALRFLGVELVRLEPLDALPDAVFVEDTAVVFDELAVLTRPGAESRRAEVDAMEPVLAPYRRIERITAPATLDGGDVLRIGRKVWVGISGRTNQEGVDQLRAILAPFGYEVQCLDVFGCLHLKSAVTLVRETPQPLLLLNPAWVDPSAFAPMESIAVAPEEPMAANALLAGDAVVFPSEFPLTVQRLRERGLRVLEVEASELAKAEGGVTCCSLLLDRRD
ncbi:MAG: arginine deiminase family protein [Thermoanaerobaculia bacterium]